MAVTAESPAEEDRLRARFYGFLASLLDKAPCQEDVESIARMDRDDATDLGAALARLSDRAAELDAAAISEEYDTLFIGVTGGVLNPYGSYYLTGFMHEKPLADLRADMMRLGLARRDEVADPEDHIAALFEIMAGMINGTYGKPAELDEQRRFFDAHIGNWAPAFFDDLEQAEEADFYRPVGWAGRLFMAIEKQAFSLE